MNKLLGLLLTAALTATTMVPQAGVAQDPKHELEALMERMELLVEAIYEEDYVIAHIEVDKLYEGQQYSFTRVLLEENNYKVIGVGGWGIKDLDVRIEDSAGEVIDEDTTDDNVPIVNANVPSSQRYTIRTLAYELEEGVEESEYFFIVVVAFQKN